MRLRLTCLLLGCCLLPHGIVNGGDSPVPDYGRDIQPILARHCFPCHGPDEANREADLRLDLRDAAIDSGAIVPGDSETSEFVRRIVSADDDERMPPPERQELTAADIELLIRWIQKGAKHTQHWAFIAPQRPALPSTRDVDWPRNPIDQFVLAKLEASQLRPSPEADRYTLVRRLYLDLIGLPPTIREAEAFVVDESAGAYEALVDRLLSSKHYGERWARAWLDLARYADTNGYEKDRPRSIWPYRDWVIKSLNDDLPFDQFTIEQLAGDMLPEATPSQKIATGFHRNTMLNEEGGIDPLEYRFYAIVDRVATTGTVWMGLTIGCAQCHAHKYDPITHADYYRMMSLLNNADEPDLLVDDRSVTSRRAEIQRQIDQLVRELPDQFPPGTDVEPTVENRRRHLEAAFSAWREDQAQRQPTWHDLVPTALSSNLPKLELLPDHSILSSGDFTKRDEYQLTFPITTEGAITALRLEVLPDDRLPAGGPGQAYYEGRKGDFFLSELAASANGKPVKFVSGSVSYGKIAIGSGDAKAENVFDGDGSTGWSTAGREGERHQLVLNLAAPLTSEQLQVTLLFERHFVAGLGRFRLAATSEKRQATAGELPREIGVILARPQTATSASEEARLREYFLMTCEALQEARQPIEELRRQIPKITTMVMQERPADNPRPTYRHHRGEYLSRREQVTPGVPQAFPQIAKERPNRLDFARWLVSEQNPLVARVVVNRAWRAIMGHGLVRTGGDFGTQSPPPTHPALLDWLATEFVDQGWSFKQLHRLIVTSATYRQSSRLNAGLLAQDPENRLWSRGPRFRVDAETIRDIMLSASGLLADKLGGPSVFPPQPASVTELAYGGAKWNTSRDEDRYRRSLYTFSKRTAPFAALMVFDATSGEGCTAPRDRSNTPLQALTLLNDEMFLEIAQAMAGTVMASDPPEQQVAKLFRRLMTRPPSQQEYEAVIDFRRQQLDRLQDGELDAVKISGSGASAEHASWVLVCRALMNLDEAITKN